ncbi:MAG: TRAP transporter small permease [Phyllobacterium sp.]
MTDTSGRARRFAAVLDRVAGSIGAILVALFSVMIVYVVFARYVLSYTPRWSEELPRLLLVWATFIGTISAFARKTHLCAGITDLIVKPGRFRDALAFCAMIATAAFLVILAFTGWKLALATWSHETTVLSLPAGLVYLALPVTSVLSLLALFLVGWRK